MRGSGLTFRLPGLVTALAYGVYASTFTPFLYVDSHLGPARVLNIHFYTFLLALFFATAYWCGWIAEKLRSTPKKKKQKDVKEEPLSEPGVVGVLLVSFVLICVVMSDSNINTMTSVSAANSLVNGEARIYHEEQKARLALYMDPDIKHVQVPALTAAPHLIYYDGILNVEAEDRINGGIVAYYNKDSITLTA